MFNTLLSNDERQKFPCHADCTGTATVPMQSGADNSHSRALMVEINKSPKPRIALTACKLLVHRLMNCHMDTYTEKNKNPHMGLKRKLKNIYI